MDFFRELFQNEIFAQGFGFLGTLLVALGFQSRSYNKVVATKITNDLISGLHYAMLAAYTGMIMNFASIATNFVYFLRIRKGKSTLPFQIIFGLMFVGLGIWQWTAWYCIFVILAKVISSVSLGIKKTMVIRIMNLISTPCWLCYDIIVGSIPGMCSDILVIVAVASALIRVDIIDRHKEKKAARQFAAEAAAAADLAATADEPKQEENV